MATEFTGGGDPKRSLELLWGIEPPARRGPKPRLSVEEIVRAAIALADAEGLGSLSMRRVAQAVSASAMSLYSYVPSKAELIDVMLDRVSSEFSPPHEAPGDWRSRLAFAARQDWDMAQRHPWLTQVGTHRPPLGPNAAARYESICLVLDGLGLSDLEIDQVISLVMNYVRGAVRRDLEAAELARDTGLTDSEWWASRLPFAADMIGMGRFPTAKRVSMATKDFYSEHGKHRPNFEFGLQRLLDGVAALIAGKGQG